MSLFYFCIGDLFNAVRDYHGHYREEAMIHFDNNRLHSESKQAIRRRKKEAGRIAQQNDDNNDQINNVYNETSDSNEDAGDDNDEKN